MGERITLLVCPKHGPQEPQELERDLSQRCPGYPVIGSGCGESLQRIEYVPAEHADALAEAVERAFAQEEWGDDFEAAVKTALTHYREATR